MRLDIERWDSVGAREYLDFQTRRALRSWLRHDGDGFQHFHAAMDEVGHVIISSAMRRNAHDVRVAADVYAALCDLANGLTTRAFWGTTTGVLVDDPPRPWVDARDPRDAQEVVDA